MTTTRDEIRDLQRTWWEARICRAEAETRAAAAHYAEKSAELDLSDANWREVAEAQDADLTRRRKIIQWFLAELRDGNVARLVTIAEKAKDASIDDVLAAFEQAMAG